VSQTPSVAGAAATAATAPSCRLDIGLPVHTPFRVEKQGKLSKMQGKANCTHCKGKGVVKDETAVSALSSMQDNTVRVADAMHHLVVQGTVQPVAGKGTAHHWTVGLAVVVSGGLGILMSTGFRLPGTSRLPETVTTFTCRW
jgi:hypothetical protein